MRCLLFILCLLATITLHAQSDLRVYTVAGNIWVTDLLDGGPATAAGMSGTEGVWIDGNCNLYFSDIGHSRVRKVDLETGIITSIAGSHNAGHSGDGGPATNAQLRNPYGIYVTAAGDLYLADDANYRIRKVDAASGIITNFAGGGASLGDGGPAANAAIIFHQSVYGDAAGNIYIAEVGRIRKVNTSGIITTIAGTGTTGLSGDGGPAVNAQIGSGTAGMLFDASGNLIFADRGNGRIRKINKTTGIITTIAGTTDGYSGDGGPATNAQLSGPISFAIDKYGNLIIGDNGNNYIRRVDASTGVITSIAGVGTSIIGDTLDGVLATTAEIHPEFLYLDLQGNLYYSNFGGQIRKIVGLEPGLMSAGSRCGPPAAVPAGIQAINIEIYPNPTNHLLHIDNLQTNAGYRILSVVGTAIHQGVLRAGNNELNIRDLPPGMYLLEVNEGGKKTLYKVAKQ